MSRSSTPKESAPLLVMFFVLLKRCRPASGTVGGRQTRLAPDGAGCWPALQELGALHLVLEQREQAPWFCPMEQLATPLHRCRKRPGFLKGVRGWSE